VDDHKCSAAATLESKRGRGRQVGSKNTPRTGLDDLQDKTLCQVCKDLELAWTDRAQAITAIHLRSGSSAKSPKTNLDDLKEDTLVLICADRNLASSGNRADLIARILGRGGRGLTSEDSKDADEPDRSAEMDVDPSSRSSDGGGPRGSPGIQKKTKRAAGGAKDYKSGDFIIFVNRLAVVRDDQKLLEINKRDGRSSPWTALQPGDERYGMVWDDPEHFAWERLKCEREGGDKKRSIKIDRHDGSEIVDLYPKIPREKKDSTDIVHTGAQGGSSGVANPAGGGGGGGTEVGGSGRINRGADAQVECARGGEGRDKGAGAGAGQKRAAPPSACVFAAMPAEKRARDDHGSGSVADDAGATAHRDLGVERCERCGRDFTQWEPQQRPAQVCLGSRSLLHRSLLLARKFSFDAVEYCR
jgi:hypothetical protein